MIQVIQYMAYACWMMFLFWTSLGLISIFYKPKRSNVRASNVEIVIVSIANEKVRRSLFETIESVRKLQLKYWVLVDEGSDLIPELEYAAIVPKDYRRDLVAKGRAMNWFIENHVSTGKWYGFVDDDNIIADDSFLYEIPWYDSQGYAAMNPRLKVRKGKSNFTFVMDSIRVFDDVTVYRFFTGLLHNPLVGLHGELLCVKGSILKQIGYDFLSITEDFRFSMKLCEHKYKTWQSATNVILRSPNSIKDLMKQRGRWFKGIVLDLKYSGAVTKILVGSRTLFWTFGLAGSWLFAFLWPTWGSFWPALPGGIVYWLLYSYGIMKLQKWYYLLTVPLIGVVESLSWLTSFKQKGFEIIDKQ